MRFLKLNFVRKHTSPTDPLPLAATPTMIRLAALSALFVGLSTTVLALNDGVGKLPPMGYNGLFALSILNVDISWR